MVFLRPSRMLPQIRPPHPPQPSTSLLINYLIIRSCITAIPKGRQARLKMIYSLMSSSLDNVYYHSFITAQQPPVGQGHLIIEDSRSHSDTPHSDTPHSDTPHSDTPHSDTPHSAGLLWTSDRPGAEYYT